MIGYLTMAAGDTSDEHERAAAAIARACQQSGRDLIEIVCDRPMPLHVDGEDLGDVDAATFEAERGAVTVLA